MEMRRRKLHPDKEEEDRSSAKDKDTNLRRSKRKAQSSVETPVAEGQLDKDKSSSSRSRRRRSSVETPVIAKELDQGESSPRKSSRPGSGIETSVAAGKLDQEASLGMESKKCDTSIRHAAKHTDQLDDELLEYVDKNIHLFESDSDDFAETTPIQDEHNYNKVLDNSSETFHSLGSLESDADDDDKEVSVLKSSPSLLLPRSGSDAVPAESATEKRNVGSPAAKNVLAYPSRQVALRGRCRSVVSPSTTRLVDKEPGRDEDVEDSDSSFHLHKKDKEVNYGAKEKDVPKNYSDSDSVKSATRSHDSTPPHGGKLGAGIIEKSDTRRPSSRKPIHAQDMEDPYSTAHLSKKDRTADLAKNDSDSSSMKSVTGSHGFATPNKNRSRPKRRNMGTSDIRKSLRRGSATRYNSKSMAQRKSTRTPDTKPRYRDEDTEDSDSSVPPSTRNKAAGDGVKEKDPSKADSDSSRSHGSAPRHNSKSRLQRKSMRTADATRKSLHRGRDHRKDVTKHGKVLDLSEEEADDSDAGSREERRRAMSPDGSEGSIVIGPAKKRSGREHRKDVRKRGEVQHLSDEEADDNDAGSREDRGRAMSPDVSEGSVVIEPARKRRATVIQPKKAKRQRQSAIKANELLEKAQYSDDDIDEEDERKTDSDESLSGDDVDGEEHGASGNLGGNAVKCRPCVVQLTRYLMDAGARSVFLSAAAVPKRGSGRPPKDAEGANSSAQGTNAAMQVDEDWSDNGVNSSSQSTSSSSSRSGRSSRSSSNRSRRDQSLSEGSSAPSSGPDTDYEPSGADSFVVEQDKSDSEEVIYHTRSKVRRKRRRKFRDVTKDHDHGSSYSSGSDLDYEPPAEEDQGKTKSSHAVPDKVKQRLRKKVRKERNVLRSESDSSSSSIFTSEGSNKASDYSDVDKDMPGPSRVSRHVSSSDAENRSASNSDMEISQPGPSTPLRGRGRPRKYISPSDAVESTPKSPSIPPRGRGRPRKDISPSDAVEQSPKSPSIPPRGRGRPRKDISPSDAVEQSPKSTSQRGRGRPRKNMNSSDAVEPSSKGTRQGSSRISLFDVDNQSSNNSDISDIENMKSGPVTPIRGKSRPRKAFGTSNESFPEHHDEDSALCSAFDILQCEVICQKGDSTCELKAGGSAV